MDGNVINVSPPSLHERVMDDLLARIQSGQFQPGEPIPTEAALCSEYGVSHITVHRAIARLVDRRPAFRRPIRWASALAAASPALNRSWTPR